MDLRKEIKLKDLLPKRKKKDALPAEAPEAAAEKPAKEKRSFSFSRKPKEPKTPRERKPKAKTAKAPTRHKKLVGLKIGASQLAAARIVNNGSPEVVQLARTELEPGIVVGGELREPDALAEALKAFFRKNKLPKQGVRLGIASNRIGVRTFEIGGIKDPKQLENAIRFRAQETLPIPLEDAVLDYQILGETVDEDGGRRVASCSSSRTASSSIATSPPAGRRASSWPESTSRRSRSCVPSATVRPTPRTRRSSSSPSDTSVRRSPCRVAKL